MPTETAIEQLRHFRVCVNATDGRYVEIDVRSEDLTDFEVRMLANSIQDVLPKHVCKNQIAHSRFVRVPTERVLLAPSDN